MASKTIKGITIQIDGQATGLGKVLKEIDQQSGKTTSNLKSVNAALKLDPTNTELIAQKQRMLGQEIETTSSRLDALKQAQENAAKSAGNFDAWKEAYDPIQKQIVSTKEKIKELVKQQEEIAETNGTASDAYKDLGVQIERLNGDLKDLKSEAKAVSDEFGNPISPDEYDKLQREIVFTNDKLKKLTAELDDTEKGMNDLGADTSKTEKKLDDFDDSVDEVENSSSSLGKTLSGGLLVSVKAVGAAVGSLITGLVAAAESTAEYRTEMGKLNTAFTQSGFSADSTSNAYKDLVGILGQTDQAVEAANHLAKLVEKEEDLARWTGDILPGVFATFGNSLPIENLTEAANMAAKNCEISSGLADALDWAGVSSEEFKKRLEKCNSEQERQALITETLVNLYGEASDAYKTANSEVIRANQANDEWMQSMSAIGSSIGPIITDIKMMGARLLNDLVPGIQAMADAARGIFNGDMEASDSFGSAMSNVITDLLKKVVDIIPTATKVGISFITSLASSLLSQAPVIVRTGTQMVAQVVSSLSTILPGIISNLISEVIPGMITNFLAYVPDLIETATELFNSFVVAIPPTIANLIQWVPEIVQGIVDTVLLSVPVLIDSAIHLFNSFVQAIPMVIPQLVETLPMIIDTLVDGIAGSVSQMVDGALLLLDGIVQAIPLIIETLVPQIPSIVTTITDGLIKLTPDLVAGALKLLMGIIEAIPKIVVEIGKAMPQVVEALASGLFIGVEAIGKMMDDAGKLVSEGIEKIKGFFGFEFKWPKLKLPHFSVTPKGWEIGDLLKGSIPKLSIKWNKEGGIFPSAAIFGAYGGKLQGGGEALNRSEALLPIDSFYQELDSIVRKYSGGGSGVVVQVLIDSFVNNSDHDIDELTEMIADRFQTKIDQKGAAL